MARDKKLFKAERMKAVFIDRDGTINIEKGFVHKIEDWEFIPGAIQALKHLCDQGIKIYVITNQSGIARGYYGEVEFHELMDHVARDLEKEGVKLERVLYCPHHPEGSVPGYALECDCRKPHTRLMEEVMSEQGFDAGDVALIGDKESDIEAGTRLGVTTYLVLTGYGREFASRTAATHVKDHILDAVRHLLNLK